MVFSILGKQPAQQSGYIENGGKSFKDQVKEASHFAMPRHSYLYPIRQQKPLTAAHKPPLPPFIPLPPLEDKDEMYVDIMTQLYDGFPQTQQRRSKPPNLWSYVDKAFSNYEPDQKSSSFKESMSDNYSHFVSTPGSTIGLIVDKELQKSIHPPTLDLDKPDFQASTARRSDETIAFVVHNSNRPSHVKDTSIDTEDIGVEEAGALDDAGSEPKSADTVIPVDGKADETTGLLASQENQGFGSDSQSLLNGDIDQSQQELLVEVTEGLGDLGGDSNSESYQEPRESSEPGSALVSSSQSLVLSQEGNCETDQHLSLSRTGGTNQPSRTPSPLVDDIGSLIVSISPDAVRVNGHFCDVFEGSHINAGKVALKRPRIGATGYDDVVIRVGNPSPRAEPRA
ncbi:hypothetical protein M407DRAFT_4836 [Tulasnella calospora MUT 4182]|uniref:Uncharacterized protein n=1 Tax=Tulasnella calospora MUT 4182 TaxID=1051891 RepID=A0A0C3QS48_9AGAM|nr:hypothetical protein M407DRAFT_4836 [Tulasnella calospora MUT 4182]